MTAQGAYLKLEGGNIMLHCPGTVNFKATQKEFAGPQRAYGPELDFTHPSPLRVESVTEQMSTRVIIDRPLQDLLGASNDGAVPYRFIDHTGAVIAKGKLDDNGATQRVFHQTPRNYTVLLGEPGDWHRVDHTDDDAVCGCGDGEHDHDHDHEATDSEHEDAPADVDHADASPEGALPAHDEAFARQLLDHLVFADPAIQQAIEDGEA
jgi:type VI secretion system secreted protein VgrG